MIKIFDDKNFELLLIKIGLEMTKLEIFNFFKKYHNNKKTRFRLKLAFLSRFGSIRAQNFCRQKSGTKMQVNFLKNCVFPLFRPKFGPKIDFLKYIEFFLENGPANRPNEFFHLDQRQGKFSEELLTFCKSHPWVRCTL